MFRWREEEQKPVLIAGCRFAKLKFRGGQLNGPLVQKGVRGLLASEKTSFLQRKNGICTRKNDKDWSIREDCFIHAERKAAV